MKNNSGQVAFPDTPAGRAIHYDNFFGPLFFEPFALEVAKRIASLPVSIVVEIAAGTGRVSRHIRENIPPTAKLIATDISDEMLSVGKNKLAHLDIEWQIMDAQALSFNDSSIDLVVCCFGYMFVPDKHKAFAEVYRVLKPGGHFLFTTWDKLENNAASFCSVSVATKYLAEPLPESSYLATSMSDAAMITQLAHDAGFEKISVEKLQLLSVSETAKNAALGFIEGASIYGTIKKRNPEKIEEIKIELEKEFASKFGTAPMIAPISALMCQARK
jgi:ubiquinone/menaquinone biosynthesis C-methylase UbiE